MIVATDANCKGRAEKLREITEITGKVTARVICAIPNPHIERWLLLDSAAFKSVFDRGCDVPDQKCERRRYKKMLMDAILQAGISPSLGGIEFADEIVDAMDLERTAQADDSLGHFIMELQAVFQGWRQ